MGKPQQSKINPRSPILNRVKLRNFKSVRDASIEIKPLTILLGTNSAGKSTLLQALALAAQNFREGSTFGFDLNSSSLTLGPLKDLFHKGAKATGNLGLGLEFGRRKDELNQELGDSYCIDIELESGKKHFSKSSAQLAKFEISETFEGTSTSLAIQPNKRASKSLFGQASNTIKGTFLTGPPRFRSSGRTAPTKLERKVHKIEGVFVPMSDDRFLPGMANDRPIFLETEVWKGLVDRYLFESQYRQFDDIWRVDYRKLTRVLAADSKKFYSKKIALEDKLEALEAWFNSWSQDFENDHDKTLLRLTLDEEEFARQNYFKTLDGVTSQQLVAFLGMKTRHGAKWLLTKTPQILPIYGYELGPAYISAQTQYRKYWLSIIRGITYLGPLRAHLLSEQKSGVAKELWAPIGIRGERLANVLESDLAKTVALYPVPKGAIKGNKFGEENLSLIQAVNRWVKWFDLGESLAAKDEGIWGSFLELDGEKFHQKGTGISQVLPVITISLLAGVGTLTMIEQPELHLHPALQQRLGTFFAEVTKSGRRLIIETHSEYIVTRIRREIATGALSPDTVALTFVSTKNEKTSRETVYEQVPISSTGVVTKWPQGFYDFTAGDKLAIFEANR